MRVLGSPALAHAFTLNLDELWESGRVEHPGACKPRPVILDAGIEVPPWFTPEYGDALSHRVAKFLGRATKRIRIASPVLTSGPILGTLVEVVNEKRCDIAGVIDETQVDEVFHQWATNGVSAWKIPLLYTILTSAPFSGKLSTQWTPESLHAVDERRQPVGDRCVVDLEHVLGVALARAGEVERADERDVVGDDDLGVHEVVQRLRCPRVVGLPENGAAVSTVFSSGIFQALTPFVAHWWKTSSTCVSSITPATSQRCSFTTSTSVAEDRAGGEDGGGDPDPLPARPRNFATRWESASPYSGVNQARASIPLER